MIKGDLRKKQILETAEALFTERGYEKTGVQDILDQLHLSKGSFYHHFESKELVLEKICERRASLAAEALSENKTADWTERMNQLLSGMIPFQGEGLSFLKMLMPVFLLPEGKSILAAYQEALKQAWLPQTAEALARMISQHRAFTLYPEVTASILLDLVNDLWGQLCREILQNHEKTGAPVTPAQLLAWVEPYRTAMENLISAPYGSLELLNPDALEKITQALWISSGDQ
ncbi:MAG: TetR/AcrR family transcriptional regulator [Clostridia bacterium]|nr:TetR/AcrR family transcriptional regulator [Clostridia bacterium]